MAVGAVANAHEASGIVAVVAAGACGVLVTALVAAWADGIVTAAVVMFLAYVVSLLGGSRPLDRAAPLVVVGLLAMVELGSWSLEVRNGADEHPLVRIRRLAALLVGAAATTSLVLVVGSARTGTGVVFVLVAAAAALALGFLIAAPPRNE